MKNEANTLLYYWSNSEGITTFLKEDEKFLVEEFSIGEGLNIYNFEKPDIVVQLENKTLLIEHFSFDSSKRIKKAGSLMKREEKIIDKKIRQTIKSKHSKGDTDVVVTETYKSEKSLKNYKENLIESFLSHYGKFEDYKINYKTETKDTKEIEFGLFIECSSLLPEVVIKGLDQKILLPVMIDEFLDVLETSIEVKHIFIPVKLNNNKSSLYYFSNIKENIHLFREMTINDSYRYIDFKTNEISASYLIPKT